MSKKQSVMKRAVSMLLTFVMVLSLIPTTVFGEGSGGSGSSITQPTNPYSGQFNYATGYGTFVRFTIVEINIPDDDSTFEGDHKPDPALNPNSAEDKFQSQSLVNSSTYRVVKTINIGATNNSANSSSYPISTWFDTNAVDYRLICQNTSDPTSRVNAITSYTQSKKTSNVEYYTWDEWVNNNKDWDLSGYELSNYATREGNDIVGDVLTAFNAVDYGGDNVTYGSLSAFSYALLHNAGLYDPPTSEEAATNPNVQPNDTLVWNNLMGRWISKVFAFDDDKTYRIIAEDGIVAHNTKDNTYWGLTARDVASLSFVDSNMRKGLGYTGLANMLTGMTDNYNQPYGFYAKPDQKSSTGYALTTVENINSAMWKAGTPNANKITNNKNVVYPNGLFLIFGMDAGNGVNTIDSKNVQCKNEYYAFGMAVGMPLKFDILAEGLTIQKTVTNTGEEYQNMDWQFSVELTPPGGTNPTGPFKVTCGDAEPQEFEQFRDLVAYLNNPITLKSGQKLVIEGLPEGTTYHVVELIDDELLEDTGSEDDKPWQVHVKDTGAENTEEVEATETTGTIPEGGRALVTFRNTKPGGPAHLIVDVNLPGATATYDDELGTIVSGDVVECGTHYVGKEVKPITAAFNGQVLEPNESKIKIGETESGEDIYALFLGMSTSPSGETSDSSLTYLGNGQYSYWIGHEDLTVLYLQWRVGGPIDTDVDPVLPSDGDLYTVFFDANYDGGPSFSSLTAKGGKYKYNGQITVGPYSGSYVFELPIKWSYPDPPVREGWEFAGWSLESSTSTPGTYTPTDPGGPDTYFGVWESKRTNWYANADDAVFESTGQDAYTYDPQIYPRGDWVPVLKEEPVREGYTFSGWYLDEKCTQPLESYEEGIQPGRNYYAGWTAERVIVTYYDTRDGTGVLETQYYNYDDLLTLFTGLDDTVGWEYVDWNTSFDGSGMSGAEAEGKFLNTDEEKGFGDLLVYHEGAAGPTEPDPEDPGVVSDRGYWTLDFYAQWRELTGMYNVQIVWNDFLNNDGARPKQIELGLVDSYNNNTIIERIPVTGDPNAETWSTQIDLEHITDNDGSLQKRTYKIVFLSYTDIRDEVHQIQAPEIDGQEGTMELAAPSLADGSHGVNTVYSYGVNNYAPDHTGTGEYDTLITFNHSLITTGDDIQFTIDWDDDNDNDGVRPGSVMLVLYANGVPVSEFPMHNAYTGEVQVSAALCDVANDGDTWTYTFKDYQRYNDGEAIDYTVAIKNPDKTTTFNLNGYTTTYIDTNGDSEIGDHNGCTVSRPIELAEVPFSIVWDDENNRDGQRPEFVSVSLMSYQWNDHTYQWEYVEMATQTVRADDVNTMTAGEWTGVFELDADSLKYPVYHDGLEAIYHLVVTSDLNAFIPEGSFEYGWVESAYGNQKKVTPQVIISQNTNTVSVTANVYWNDSQNNDDIRPENIILQLYSHAPGEEPVAVPGAAYRVTISGEKTADNWYYTFPGMPKYAEGQSGVEIKLYPVAYRL